MSYTDESWYTILKRGLKGKDGYIAADKTMITDYPPSQVGKFSVTNSFIAYLGTATEFYNNAYNLVIFRPYEIVTSSDDPLCPLNVAYVKFNKPANTTIGGFDFYDSNDNYIYGDIADATFGRPGDIYIDNLNTWIRDPNGSVWIGLYCETNPAETVYNTGFCLRTEITTAAKTLDPWGANPGKDIFKAWEYVSSTSGSPSTNALMDSWCYGDYWTPGGTGGRPDPNGGGSDGGEGGYKWPNENIPIPGLPTKSAASAGFMRIYRIDDSELEDLATELWDPSFWNTIVKNFQSPFDNIISLSIIPYDGLIGTLEQVQIGNYKASVAADKLGNTYFELDCGNMTLSEEWGYGNFLDFAINLQLYLPYCGTININPQEFMYGTINVTYHFDIFSGSCVAYVSAVKDGVSHVLYEVEGNIKTEIPINARNYVSVYASALSAGASMFGAGASAMRGDLGGVVSGMTNAATTLMTMKPDYMKSGNIGGTHGLMGIQYPYLIATIPKCYEADNYKALHGYISYKKAAIGDLTGYVQVTNGFDDLDTIAATEEEKRIIKQALAEGIYI